MARDLDQRLRDLEQHDRDLRWCRCPFDHDRFQREVVPLMGVAGVCTPNICPDCGGHVPVIEFVAMDSAIAWRETAP